MFPWYEDDIADVEKRWRRRPPPPNPIVFYGSSSIRLWAWLREDFPNQVVANAGFGGSTLAACAWFFERMIVPLAPRAMVVYAGENDLGDGQTPEQVLTSWSELVTKIDRHLGPIPLAFVSIKPSPARFAILKTIRKTNDLVEATIAQRPQTMYIDVYSSMLDDEGLPFERLFIGDGLHLSRDGYLLWREVIGRCIANITDGTAAT